MKIFYSLIVFFALSLNTLIAQDSTALQTAAIESSFKYQHGTIAIGNGIATITVPAGFKYLDSAQAFKVLTKFWGNPETPNMTLGFILPENQGVMDAHGYVFNVQYDALGYVKDDDANEINYDDLLTKLQTETNEENANRKKEGYEPITIVGWAAKPYYDSSRHILHWAKEVKFGTDSINTLNYNVRVLGRKGVLVLNAISTMQEINAVKAGVPHVLSIVNFTNGNKYSDFDSGIDKVAAWTIGGLVAGKILAKVGFFALILKFWKIVAVGFVALGSFIRKLFKGRQSSNSSPPEEKEPIEAYEAIANEEEQNEAKPKDETMSS
ncbi:MAG: DUF2167 domain-containing protein [Bacteroidota bacterium]